MKSFFCVCASLAHENEVVLLANTQLRVVGKPGPGILAFLEAALMKDLSRVLVVELEEIDFFHWGQLGEIMTDRERARNARLLEAVQSCRGSAVWKTHPVSGVQFPVEYPLSTSMPRVQ
eukprot:Hpha_TRINITY_DN1370_c0_g1::TRINITY_DN1370_c0_g1_i1::g.93407::m.93407